MSKLKNEIGNQYGLLTVIERAPNKNNKVYWKCRCQCGREHIVSGTNLRTGQVKSCGQCVNNNHKQNLIGNIYGALRVIKEAPSTNRLRWECECIFCGKHYIVDGTNLKTGHTKSCSCIHGSTGEKIIERLLQQYNIQYKTQYTFLDCITDNNKLCKFDFAIFDKNNQLLCLVEYDGEQHYIVTGGWNNDIQHQQILQHDKLKNQYCIKNNIPLVRIPYYDINKITIQYLLEKIEQEIKNDEEVSI